MHVSNFLFFFSVRALFSSCETRLLTGLHQLSIFKFLLLAFVLVEQLRTFLASLSFGRFAFQAWLL